MSRALGSPSHDPHGAPIPTTAGVIEETDLMTLADAEPGTRLRIRAVRDEHSADLRSMAREGLVPGTWVTVGLEPTADGSILVLFDAGSRPRHAVAQKLARQIYVVSETG